MSSLKPDWSEALATMPARMNTLANFLHDRRFDKADQLIRNLEDDLSAVSLWIRAQKKELSSEEKVWHPTSKLRWHKYKLEQLFVSDGKLEEKWIEVPVVVES